MIRVYISTVLFLATGIALVSPSAAASFRRGSLAPAASLTGVQLFFRSQPVDQIVLGTKLKKYSMELTGTGFASGSSVVVDSSGVCVLTSKPTQTLVTVDQGSSSLLAAFPRRTDLLSGLLSVKVVSPDGTESNSLRVDVISNPSDLSIDSISPQSGPIGTQVTLTGVGFKQGDPIRFSIAGSAGANFVGFYSLSGSASGSGPLRFTVETSALIGICAHCIGSPACDPAGTILTTPSQYRVSIVNANGMSNSLLFQVTSQ